MSQNTLSGTNIIITWIYLPEPKTLSQYFNSNDLIELSKVCKKYRNQLKSQVLRTITIPQDCGKLYDSGPSFSKYTFDYIMDYMKRDLFNNTHLVKEIMFQHCLTVQLTKDIFALFPKISRITISNRNHSLKALAEVLYDSNYLEHITLRANSKAYVSLSSKFTKFFKNLKSVKLIVFPEVFSDTLQFDIIDSSFSNLRYLTIANNSMLTKLSNGFPSLVFVEFTEHYLFEKAELLKFIINNPQLKKLTIATDSLNCKITNSILRSNSLHELHLTKNTGYNEIDFTNCTENLNIKHLKYSGLIYNEIVIGIVKACKNLEAFEMCKSSYRCLAQFRKIEKLLQTHTLLISYSDNACNISSFLSKLTKINNIKFINGCKLGEIVDKLQEYDNNKWVPKQAYSMYTDEFTLVRR
ncbi:hypothetical protein CONCODRAFT_12172 [Conidiobolus coronatus NRRL 28638]|uniref:F-box domain-containing protein n=1 Tax=Conidiobolus coronatus (strain ATCC 28846 / CBS 209.66 / NRRL 28638) TaxID=796925 RepID=A0A137NTH1_CONC2|nr:hypothetical protein CONCODRAFT_12172 [Conidiobolus coronatus NRRL 28638]|eukprot:KXN66060.1 hypothetical protein CONCODRAFT_12172 [Conidiobolus coronatus NRRL 28638]